MKHKIVSVLLAAVLLLGFSLPAAAETPATEEVLAETAAYVYETVTEPQVGSVGGEWAVYGLHKSGFPLPKAYLDGYLARVEDYTKACGGVLHKRKYTEYSRVVLTLSTLGADAGNVGGYDLVKPLEDYDAVIWQGHNGPAWAIIAMDAAGHTTPVRQRYVDYLLSVQENGAWALMRGRAADVDVTAMVLQALSGDQADPRVKAATDAALLWLGEAQDAFGGYATAESVAQVLVALCRLGISLDDARFVKNGNTLVDGLLRFRTGKGFRHTLAETEPDLMATEQALYALADVNSLPEEKPTTPAPAEPTPQPVPQTKKPVLRNLAEGCYVIPAVR